MPTEATFRFSTYLTLALACVTLGYAQSELLPEVAVFAGLAVVALGVLYFLETRVTMLSIPAANRLGLGVSIVYLGWVAYRIKRELDTGEFHAMGWHMLIVAMCGPLIMMVMPAKVARSDKHVRDYWTLHGAAIAGVGLAAAFAEEPACFVLVGLYLLAAVWSLTLFHLARAAGHVPPVPDPTTPAPKTASIATAPHGSRSDFRPALICAIIAAAVAVPMYLLTPRSEASKADFGKPRIEIGYAADQMVDLNRTGPLKTNSETAFEVTATHPDGAGKTDLSADQRWRGRTHQRYAGGEWKKDPARMPSLMSIARQTSAPWVPPDLGPGQFTLTYEVPPKLPSFFLADPVMWLPNKHPPIAGLTQTGPRGWLASPDGTFYWEQTQLLRGRPATYIQVYRKSEDPDLGPGFQLASTFLDDSLVLLRNNPVPRVREYADKLIADLIQAGELPAEWRDPAKFLHPATRLPREEHHDLIARKFSQHLATTSSLRYTTDLRRENTQVDPIEDFLFHSKAGHCERFATALVLLLRSQGIPAMFVLGFKGCEHVGAGKYLVKQEFAHAWAEALVSLPVPEDERRAGEPLRRYHWRSLDPTPGGADADANPNGPWWGKANAWVETRFQEYVTNYTPEQRRKALANFVDRIARIETLLGLSAVALLLVGIRAIRRRRANRTGAVAATPEPTRWFGKLVALLIANGFVPVPGETAREFAERATAGLRERPGCSEVAEVPIAWAEAYYQDRFGGVPPSDARLPELENNLDALRRALTN